MKMSSARVRCKSVPSRELSTLILHRDTGITDPERPFKHECSCGRWFTALDWHLHGCWTGSECQYDEPPSILHEYERFLAYDLLCEALGQVGVLAPIRYKHPSRMGRGRGKIMRGFMRFVRSSRLLMVGAIAFIITLAAALAAFLCDRLGVGVPWLPSGLHAVSALSGLTAGASPVLHSDMGWQYRHPWWRERLGELGIRQSMSRKGNCLDNAATEQVFGHLKDEFYRDREFDS